MKLLFKDLEFHSIEKLTIRSLEQALYQAVVSIGGEQYVVWETPDKVLLTRNLTEMRERFQPLRIPETTLSHESAHDQMIGQPVGTDNKLEVKLGGNPYAVPKWLH